jgi:hypothetical protein
MLQSDLKALLGLVSSHVGPLTEGDIRLASVIMRKWLVGGLLGRIGNLTRKKFAIPTLDNSAVCERAANNDRINFFLTGGIYMNDKPIMGILDAKGPSTGELLLPFDKMEPVILSVDAFLRQRRIFFEGNFFTCGQIIEFVANKLGGAHLDYRRDKESALMEEAAAYMTYGGPPIGAGQEPPSQIYMILEPKSTEILTSFHLETIAAAASFVQVRFDGEAVVDIVVTKTLKGWIKKLLGIDRGPKVITRDY